MLRSARHAKILEIISHKEIETQEELCAELNKLNASDDLAGYTGFAFV